MHPTALYQWTQRVASHFPELSACQARTLAQYSFGLVLAHCCGLSAVALALAKLLGQSSNTCRQRLREWYQPADAKAGRCRTDVDASVCFGPLLGWVLATWTCRRLALALDPTYLGDRFIVLAVSVVYRGCAIPVAWKVVPADQKGSWLPHWQALLDQLEQRLDPGWLVTVLSDRGLESKALFESIVQRGWHPLMRVKAAGTFRPAGWHGFYPMARLVPHVGSRWRGRGEAYKSAKVRLRCTLLACWEPGHAEPWLILTDLDPSSADAAWYGWRCWIEQGFKVAKRGGWQWQRTRMADAARAERLWVVPALATLWLLEVGGVADLEVPRETIAEVQTAPEDEGSAGRRRRLHAVFRQGLYAILAALVCGPGAPEGRFEPEDWPEVPEWHNTLTEQSLQTEPSTYP